MDINRKSPVAEVATEVRGAASVFEFFGIDYSCAGGKTIEEAARAEGIDPARLVDALLEIPQKGTPWPQRSLTDLARHLVAQHHRLLRDEFTRIAIEMVEVGEKPAPHPQSLRRLHKLFGSLTELVMPHLHQQERSLLLAIEALDGGAAGPGRGVEMLDRQIADTVVTHGEISDHLRQIRELRLEIEHRGGLPDRVSGLLQRMAWLEANLHEYMFLENCILLPRAIALQEEKVRGGH